MLFCHEFSDSLIPRPLVSKKLDIQYFPVCLATNTRKSPVPVGGNSILHCFGPRLDNQIDKACRQGRIYLWDPFGFARGPFGDLLTYPDPRVQVSGFMSLLLGIFTFLLVLIALFMMLVILMQRSKTDGGVGAALGGGMAESTFGAETNKVLFNATRNAAIGFFVLSFALYLGHLWVRNNKAEEAGGLPDALPALSPVDSETDEPLTSDRVSSEQR